MNRRLVDYVPEMEFLEESEAPPPAAPSGQVATMALGADLLDSGNRAQLEAFLSKLVSSIAARQRIALGAPLRQALVAALTRAARAVMPVRGNGMGAAGTRTPARMFGMELEGLSPEDKEYEVAQQYIRLAADTVHHAATAKHGSPSAVADAALAQAARRYAPGLLPNKAAAPQAALPAPSGGRWQRQGRRIIVLQC